MRIILIFILTFSYLFSEPDPSGWVLQPRPYVEVEGAVGVEDGIWAVFSKKLSSQKFTIRFPEEPSYLYLPEGIEVFASKDGELFSLIVQEENESFDFEEYLRKIEAGSFLMRAEKGSFGDFEISYQQGSKLFQERVLEISNCIYILRVVGDKSLSENASVFFDSLYVE